jgi:hypothetical protein
LTKVDQKGSLGFVGDGFEVMAQVGRRLTKVNTVDPLIRVNLLAENLGRHSLPPLNRISSRDSTIRVEQLFLIKIRVTRWEIYPLTFLDSENSDGAKDTRCYPHCLNAVHEEADDGCVHGKLQEDKLRRGCRGTSL